MTTYVDPYDVPALEKSVNESAVRFSTIWVSYLIFGLYLVIAAGNVTHRQLFLADPIKLPALNIDLPLVGFFFLAPVLFVILHMYVLLQLVLLARTASAYNDAIDRNEKNETYRARIRQRLANTLFAQLFAGSPTEREGALGWLLKAVSWVALVIGPICVLLVFEIKFLPYHSHYVTWTHRILIFLDLIIILLMWSPALNTSQPIGVTGLVYNWRLSILAAVCVLTVFIVPSFPGEIHAGWTRRASNTDFDNIYDRDVIPFVTNECILDSWFSFVFPQNFDRLFLQDESFVDDEVFSKIEVSAKDKGQYPYEGQRTHVFNGRDFSCADLRVSDLRRSNFEGTTMIGTRLSRAEIQGANFARAQLQGAEFINAHVRGASFFGADLRGATLSGAYLQGVNLEQARLELANLRGARLQDAGLDHANLQGASLEGAFLRGAYLFYANLQGASLRRAGMQGATLKGGKIQGAIFDDAGLQTALIDQSELEAASFERARLQGALIGGSSKLANFSYAFLWRSNFTNCDDIQLNNPNFSAVLGTAELTPIQATDEGINTLVRIISDQQGERLSDRVEQRLREMLNNKTTDQLKLACDGKARSVQHYEDRLGAYLLDLSCNSKDNSIPIAIGIARRLKYNFTQKPLAQAFLRLLSDANKYCSAAKIIKEASLDAVKQFTAAEAVP
jgi:uncharacterized protein YjbI with pentapeptide repeats